MYVDNRDWSLYNQRLVNRGRIVTIFLKENALNWKDELDRMNRGKRGSPYEYPNTIIWIGFGIKCLFHLRYRQLQGFMEDVCTFLNFSIPDFRTFWWRVNNEKHRLLFSYQAQLDLRIGEVVKLNLKDMDFKTRELRVFTKKAHTLDTLIIPIALFNETNIYIECFRSEIVLNQGYIFFRDQSKDTVVLINVIFELGIEPNMVQ